jgi:RNA recognition motif-containing protein
MPTHNKSSRRHSGRGPRRDRRRDDYPPAASAPKAPEQQTLWQKIVGFFTGKKTPARPARQASAARPPQERNTSTVTNSYPAQPSARSVRKPEAVEVTTEKLYVGNLSFDATESDLSELFAGVGSVRSADIVSHKDTERSKGFGFVTMTSVEEAKRAVEVLHDKEFMGRKLVVSGAKTPLDR